MNRDIRMSVSDVEKTMGRLTHQNAKAASDAIRNSGYLVLDNLFGMDEIDALRKEIFTQLSFQKRGSSGLEHTEHTPLNEGRDMIPLWFKGPILNDNIYANNYLLSICNKVLSYKFVIGGIGAVISYPGADAQRVHCDGDFLFQENLSITNDIPAYALTVAIPLVELNDEIGGTSVLLGSHKSDFKSKLNDDYFNEHCVREHPGLGGCAIWDYRLMHRGEANTSDIIRPYFY